MLVFQDDVWSASLLFSRVDLDHKEGILGQQAKFRNARVSYFTGDFNWAQAQLDIFKASTSKLDLQRCHRPEPADHRQLQHGHADGAHGDVRPPTCFATGTGSTMPS